MADHVTFQNGSGTDGLLESAALAQLHPTLGVMVSIFLLPLRHPVPVARQLSTIATQVPGRFSFGVGIGGEDPRELAACGIDPRSRGARTNEQLAILRKLMQGDSVDFSGDHFELSGVVIKPAPDPCIPIIVGGRSDAALRRCGRYADGWVGVWCSPARYREALERVNDAHQRSGRDPVQWQHGYQPWIGVDSDPRIARSVVKEAMERFYRIPFEKFERYTPYGTPAEVAERLAPYAQSGCNFFNLKVCTQHAEEEIALGGEVVAQMSQTA